MHVLCSESAAQLPQSAHSPDDTDDEFRIVVIPIELISVVVPSFTIGGIAVDVHTATVFPVRDGVLISEVSVYSRLCVCCFVLVSTNIRVSIPMVVSNHLIMNSSTQNKTCTLNYRFADEMFMMCRFRTQFGNMALCLVGTVP